jgi:hypothetical protein
VRTGQGGLDSHHVEALDFDPGSQDDVVAHVATFNSDEVGPSRLEAAVYDVEIAVGVVDLGLIYRYDEHIRANICFGCSDHRARYSRDQTSRCRGFGAAGCG